MNNVMTHPDNILREMGDTEGIKVLEKEIKQWKDTKIILNKIIIFPFTDHLDFVQGTHAGKVYLIN